MRPKRDSLLTELYNLYKEEVALTDLKIHYLEYLYEIALAKEGRFEWEEATSLYTSILLLLQELKLTKSALRLRASCLTRLGSIKRDQGKVRGVNGAIVLYEQALRIWRELGDLRRIAQVLWYLGACNEMQKKHDQALKYYVESLNVMDSVGISDDPRGKVLIRIGTVLTKIDEIDVARKILSQGVQYIEKGVDPSYYAYAKQKEAILLAKEGKLDKSLYIVSESLSLVPQNHKFRMVQTKILFADLMFQSGELNAALEAAAEAEEIAQEYSFGHQMKSLYSIIEKHLA